MIAIDVDGNIFPCQTAINNTPICNINDKIDILEELKKQKSYCVGYNLTIADECKNCSIYDLCGGGCKLNHKEENRKHTCYIIKSVVLYLMKAILKKEN